MTLNANVLGIGLIFIAAVCLLALMLLRTRMHPAFRSIPAVQRLRRAIGLAVEQGKRLHVSLGRAGLVSPENATALVGLAALGRIADLSMVSDRPPLATSGDGAVALLSQDTLQAAYRAGHAEEQFDPNRAWLAGTTPMAYAAGVLPVIRREQVSANLLVGDFGPEIALLCDAAGDDKGFVLAGSNALTAQAVLYATSEAPLVGEEVFALPAYLQAGPIYTTSLQAEDLLRWVVIAGLIAAVVFKLLAEMFGVVLI